MLSLLLAASTAFQPHLVPASGLAIRPEQPLARSPPPNALEPVTMGLHEQSINTICSLLADADAGLKLPKWIVPIFFIPWGVQIGYAIEKGLNIDGGPFEKFVRSDFFQKSGGTMRVVDKSAPPRVRPKRLSREAAEIVQGFKREYDQKEVELLWAALLECYGSQQRALEAVRLNPQVINPSYSFANTLLDSRDTLRSTMGNAEALEVMLLNPAVLQCGPSLDALGASEIRSMAEMRSMGNQLIPEELRAPAVGLFVGAIALAVLSSQATDPDFAALVGPIKPVIGGGVAGLLAIVVYGIASSGRSVKTE